MLYKNYVSYTLYYYKPIFPIHRIRCCDLPPSCWGTFRTPRFPPQLLGNVSHAAISSPVAGERFAPVAGERFAGPRILPQLLGNVSQGRESFPSCWGAFPAPGFLPQSLGSVSSIRNPSPAAGRQIQPEILHSLYFIHHFRTNSTPPSARPSR